MVLVHTIWVENPMPRDLVRPRQQHRVHDRGAGRVRADVGDVLDRDRLDDALGVDRHPHVPVLVARVGRRDQVLAPILDPLDRASEQPRREHDRALLPEHVHLLAEPAADVVGGDVHRALGDAEVAGEKVAGLVHRLGRAHDVELLAPRHIGRDDPTRLHRHRDVAVLLDGELHHVCGAGERVVQVAGERHERHRDHRVRLEAP